MIWGSIDDRAFDKLSASLAKRPSWGDRNNRRRGSSGNTNGKPGSILLFKNCASKQVIPSKLEDEVSCAIFEELDSKI